MMKVTRLGSTPLLRSLKIKRLRAAIRAMEMIGSMLEIGCTKLESLLCRIDSFLFSSSNPFNLLLELSSWPMLCSNRRP